MNYQSFRFLSMKSFCFIFFSVLLYGRCFGQKRTSQQGSEYVMVVGYMVDKPDDKRIKSYIIANDTLYIERQDIFKKEPFKDTAIARKLNIRSAAYIFYVKPGAVVFHNSEKIVLDAKEFTSSCANGCHNCMELQCRDGACTKCLVISKYCNDGSGNCHPPH
jgi:hypothetical protein